MRLISKLLLATIFAFAGAAHAQDSSPSTDIKTIFKKEYYGGVILHTQGLGLNFRASKFLNVDRRRLLSIEAVNIRHAKEFKTFNPTAINGNKSFVYGKKNSLLTIRPTYGREMVMFHKLAKRGVQVSRIWQAGPSLAFLKPVYVVVQESQVDGFVTSLKKYDEFAHRLDMIQGRGPMLKGIEESVLVPGVHLKYGFNFEYAPEMEMVRSFEVGLNLDAYYKPITIMAFENDQQFFLTLYANFFFGKKYLQ
jgi:hypothetical protein